MISTVDEEYKAAKEVKKGNLRLRAKYHSFTTWIYETFGLKPLHIMTFELPDAIRLEIIFEYEKETRFFESFGVADSLFNKKKSKRIIDYFSFHFLPKNHKRLFVTFSSFAPFAISEAQQKMTVAGIKSIESKYKIIWKIHSGYVLFYTIRQQNDSRNNVIKKQIIEDYYRCIKPYDKFDYISLDNVPIHFTSKEHFYKNYGGNWYNLYR
ncbi:hypothetical protein [Marixanthomonas spongiae]|uniref:Uncharacterized protein n=1 Tax=Marixanthomonas spongiae TaxID=2174845 RepID=A0A2U0HSB5_9FLAO|nr:hypothetical protein [Marixanthomonas spongiae]PVW11719.1 hypothetical protein DDV96_15590 [Marixanthomonas spongiae]